jgi:hypothetical protein
MRDECDDFSVFWAQAASNLFEAIHSHIDSIPTEVLIDMLKQLPGSVRVAKLLLRKMARLKQSGSLTEGKKLALRAAIAPIELGSYTLTFHLAFMKTLVEGFAEEWSFADIKTSLTEDEMRVMFHHCSNPPMRTVSIVSGEEGNQTRAQVPLASFHALDIEVLRVSQAAGDLECFEITDSLFITPAGAYALIASKYGILPQTLEICVAALGAAHFFGVDLFGDIIPLIQRRARAIISAIKEGPSDLRRPDPELERRKIHAVKQRKAEMIVSAFSKLPGADNAIAVKESPFLDSILVRINHISR